MTCAILLLALVVEVSLAENAKDEPDPLNCTKELIEILNNSDMSIENTSTRFPPVGFGNITHSQVRAWVCDGATLRRLSSETKRYASPDSSAPLDVEITHEEERWDRELGRVQSSIELLSNENWPYGEVSKSLWRHELVIQHSDKAVPMKQMWQGGSLVVQNFITEHAVGIPITDVVTSGGRLGYVLDETKRSGSGDNSQVTYYFSSPKYGKCEATFHKYKSTWRPIRYLIVNLGPNYTHVPANGETIPLQNNLVYTSFSSKPHALDKLETDYEIKYDERLLPLEMSKKCTEYYLGKSWTETDKSVFKSFRSGNITEAEVKNAMLPLLDGTSVMKSDAKENRLSWIVKDGLIVKSIDLNATQLSTGRQFLSQSHQWIVILANVTVAIIGVTAYLVFRNRSR